MMTTTASLFTGGGGWDVGMVQAGLQPVWGVEIDSAKADYAELNIPGLNVIRDDVSNVDYSVLPKVDHLHASPSCKNASGASEGEETDGDLAAAQATCNAVLAIEPKTFTLENVWLYRHFKSFWLIVNTLKDNGYYLDWWHLNAANYGVPQTRKRLILIASKHWQPQKPQPTHSKTPDMFGVYKPWVSWYEAVEDLIDTLPETELAPWQIARLPEELTTGLFLTGNTNLGEDDAKPGRGFCKKDTPVNTVSSSNGGGMPKAVLVDPNNTSRLLTVRNRRESSFTISATHMRRPSTTPMGLVDCKVVSMTPRALARFQSFPDWYELPDKNKLACEIIGNAVPCLLAESIARTAIELVGE